MMLFQEFQLLVKILEAVISRRLFEKVFWKYSWNLQENTHAEVWFQ